jgi:hypothetical protein
MKKLYVLILLFVPASVFCQGLFNKLKQKVKSKTEQRVDQKMDKGVDKVLDKAESAAKPKPSTANSTTAKKEEPVTKEPAVAIPATDVPVQDVADTGNAGIKSYSKFDFIPGDEIVYAENFEQDAIGELPTGWNTSGKGQVVTLDKFPGKWLQIFMQSTYLTANKKDFGDNYTIEFDVIMQLKYNGHFYPYFSFLFRDERSI